MKKLKIFLLFFSLIFLLGCQKQIENHVSRDINISWLVNTLSGDETLISLSSSNRIKWLIDKWPLTLSWSYWIDSIYIKSMDLDKYYYSWLDNKKVVYYDEYAWRRAGLIVYILRNILNNRNVALYIPNSDELKYCQNCVSWNITWNFNIDFSWWAIWTGKFRIVYDPTKVKFNSRDLLLYVSDAGTMKEDNFYKKFTWNIANFYWSYLVDINWKLKSKKEVVELLKRKGINFADYERIYLYYPKYWWRSGIVALYFNEIFK